LAETDLTDSQKSDLKRRIANTRDGDCISMTDAEMAWALAQPPAGWAPDPMDACRLAISGLAETTNAIIHTLLAPTADAAEIRRRLRVECNVFIALLARFDLIDPKFLGPTFQTAAELAAKKTEGEV